MPTVRDSFFNEIYNQIRSDEDIYVITADLGAPSLDALRKDFPNRYISAGIAEQNLIEVSSGLAWTGKKVVAYGLNPFPITRAFDQVRCLMAELKVPFTLCALNAGLCSAESGYSHMPIEDFSMLRALSNVEIYNPSDEYISTQLAKQTSKLTLPRIIRFDKSISGYMYDYVDFDKGFAVQGNDEYSKVGVVASGCYSKELSPICSKLNIKLIDIFKFPFNESSLINELAKCEQIVTVEENVLKGGLGSSILELLSDFNLNKRVKRFGLNFTNGYYGVFTNKQFIRKDQLIDIDSLERNLSNLLQD